MLSNEEICRRLPGHPGYEQLKTQRRRVAFAFASVCLGLCMAFILAAVMSPASLAVPLNREGTLTSGVACATGLIALSWGLTEILFRYEAPALADAANGALRRDAEH